jgi:tetratricopeptide (TPR) repeat protein
MIDQWTGTGIQDEIATAAHSTGAKAILTGTERRTAAGTRLSLHLIDSNGTSTLGNWLVPGDGSTDAVNATAKLIRPIYQALDTVPAAAIGDPLLANEHARGLFTIGSELLGRRNLSDMDRAITCFEGAVHDEPRSISARSYLAMAYMGRDILGSQPQLAQKALRTAKETVELAPSDPTANRASCAVHVTYGQYQEAIDYGFRALEFGDRSERAFGQIAFSWHMAGRPDKAIKWYKIAKISHQQLADYDNLLGDCWADLGLDSKAQAAYQAAADLRPDQPDGWIGLCRLKVLAGDWDEARQTYSGQLEHYAGSPAAKQMAAMVEFYARNYEKAEQLYSELNHDDPLGGGHNIGSGSVSYQTALARLRMEKNDHDAAVKLATASLESFKSRLTLAPNDMLALYNIAAAEAIVGDRAASLAHLNQAIARGWLDYRSTQMDPCFDAVRSSAEFQDLISKLTTKVAGLGRQQPAETPAPHPQP